MLAMKISGLPCLSIAVGSWLLPGTRSRVEVNAITLPLSLMVASRLSSAMKGGKQADAPEVQLLMVNPDRMPPGDGARLAGVLVMRVNVPVVRSLNPTSAPLERFAISAMVN